MSDNNLMPLAGHIGGLVAAGVTDGDRERIEAELRSAATVTALRPHAVTVVRELDADATRNRVQAVKLLRDRTGCGLYEGVQAVDWAIGHLKTMQLDRCRQPSDFGWVYRFPNGHDASVINDPHRPFRFEVNSKALNVGGDNIAGLTSEQVEAKLHEIAALPTR